MLRLRVHRSDLERMWRPTAHGWSAGRSRVSPLRHPSLEEVALGGHGRFFLTVRERCAGAPAAPSPPSRGDVSPSAPEWERALTAALAWPLQSVTVVIRAGTGGDSPGTLTVHAGPWGTGSLYAVAGDGELHADWDPGRLYHLLGQDCLDPLRTAAFLAWFDVPYSRRTLLRDMRLLCAGSHSTWPAGDDRTEALRIAYPPPVDLPRIGRPAPGSDVPGAVWKALTAAMRRWTGPGGAADEGRAACEVSGGLDSSLVAACAATLTSRPLRTYGLTMPGVQRAGQQSRRAELIDRFGLVDTARPLEADPPLSPAGGRACARGVVPWEECYHESAAALFATAAADGVRSLFTGFGGDELCIPHPHDESPDAENEPTDTPLEHDPVPPHLSRTAREMLHDAMPDPVSAFDPAPRGHVAESAVDSVTSGGALYLRHGIWPLHPLCTPELSRLCRRLPARWRAGRTVQRDLLARLGLPGVSRPEGEDDFSPALSAALRGPARPLLTELFGDPLLAGTRLIDPRALSSGYQQWADGGPGDALPFYSAAILELTLRSVEAAGREHAP